MRVVAHRATIEGTADEWHAVADHVGNPRLERAIRAGVDRQQPAMWDPVRGFYRDNAPTRIVQLRFSGGSIKRIADAIVALNGEGRA